MVKWLSNCPDYELIKDQRWSECICGHSDLFCGTEDFVGILDRLVACYNEGENEAASVVKKVAHTVFLRISAQCAHALTKI